MRGKLHIAKGLHLGRGVCSLHSTTVMLQPASQPEEGHPHACTPGLRVSLFLSKNLWQL